MMSSPFLGLAEVEQHAPVRRQALAAHQAVLALAGAVGHLDHELHRAAAGDGLQGLQGADFGLSAAFRGVLTRDLGQRRRCEGERHRQGHEAPQHDVGLGHGNWTPKGGGSAQT